MSRWLSFPSISPLIINRWTHCRNNFESWMPSWIYLFQLELIWALRCWLSPDRRFQTVVNWNQCEPLYGSEHQRDRKAGKWSSRGYNQRWVKLIEKTTCLNQIICSIRKFIYILPAVSTNEPSFMVSLNFSELLEQVWCATARMPSPAPETNHKREPLR